MSDPVELPEAADDSAAFDEIAQSIDNGETIQNEPATPEPTLEPEANVELEGQEAPQEPAEPELTIDDYQKRVAELEQRIRSDEGRVAAYQRKAEQQQQQMFQDLQKQMEQDWGAFQKAQPELAKLFDQRLSLMAGQQQQQILQQRAQMQAQAEQQQFESAQNDLMKEHSDALEVKDSQEFQQWLSQQPQDYQQLALSSRDPAMASRILTEFKSSTAAQRISQERQQALTANVAPPTAAQPEQTVVDDFDAIAAEIDSEIRKSY